MSVKGKGFSRRQFMQTGAMATAVAAATSGLPLKAGAAEPKRGGTLVLGVQFLIQTPDPQRYTGSRGQQAIAMSWDGLIRFTSVKEKAAMKAKGMTDIPAFQGVLADSWEIDKGSTRYVFHLKKGIKFHNGKEFGADDVKWSWERIKDPNNKSTMRNFLAKELASVDVADKYTVAANLNTPYAPFMVASTSNNTVILPADTMPSGVIWGETPTFTPPTPAPPGTGPFVMTEYRQNFQAVFEAYKDYREEGKPYLDKVVFKVVNQDGPRTIGLRAGDFDMISDVDTEWLKSALPEVKPYEVQDVDGGKLKTWSAELEETICLYMNCREDEMGSPFRDTRVRQALDKTLDHTQLAKTLYGQFAKPIYQTFASSSAWYFDDVKPRPTDIPAARKLLADAGYDKGLAIEFKTTPTFGKNDLAAQIIQQMSGQAGFKMNIVIQKGVQYWANLRKFTFQLFTFTNGEDDPAKKATNYLRTDPKPPYNGIAPISGIKNPELDKLIDEMNGESDFAKRKALYRKVHEQNVENAWYIPYFAILKSHSWHAKVKNLDPTAYNIPEGAFKEVWVE